MTRLRLRYGMRWRRPFPMLGDYPGIGRMVLGALFILVVLFWMQARDAEAANRADTEQVETLLLDVLNRQPVLYYENGSGKGYGRTYLIIKIEEISV